MNKKNHKALWFAALFFMFQDIAAADHDIWLRGFVVAEGPEKETVPFATLSFFESENGDDLAYFVATGPCGNLAMRPYAYKKDYYVTIEAPGYKTKKVHIGPIPETWPDGTPLRYNYDVFFRLEREQPVPACPQRDATPHDAGKAKTLRDVLGQMPEVGNVDGNWVANDGRAIYFCLDYQVVKNDESNYGVYYGTIMSMPLSGIKRIERYDLGDGHPYGAVLNIITDDGAKCMPTCVTDRAEWKESYPEP